MNVLRLLRRIDRAEEVDRRLDASIEHLERAVQELRALALLVRDERGPDERHRA